MKEIPLSRGMVSLVDDEDFERVSQYRWVVKSNRTGQIYAHRALWVGGKRTSQTMHRFILGLTNPRVQTDHRDGDGLNNQKQNIRTCGQEDNAKNRRKLKPSSSQYKGVAFRDNPPRWIGRIRVSGKYIWLGAYMTEIAAAQAYNAAAQEHFGEFAKLNRVEGKAPVQNKRQGYNETRRQRARALQGL